MRLAFLVEELGRSGGMAVVRARARRLRRAGDDAVLVVTGAGAIPSEDAGIPVRRLADLAGAAVDVAVATWWTTAGVLWDLDAARRVVFLQNLEHRYYREGEEPERLAAAAVLDLPVDYVVIAAHMAALLARLRPDARVRQVPIGIDKAVFTPAGGPRPAGPLRVLVEGQPTLWFKGVQDAVATVRAMAEPATVTVAAHDPGAAEAVALRADRLVGGLDAAGMAALYREHDVLLKLSRFEGLALPPLEGFHTGLPCVVTPFTGSEEWARHGENCLVVGFDDRLAAAAALDCLARDAALRRRLGDGALATAAAWPGEEESCDAFATALRDFAAAPPPPPDAALRRMAHGRQAVTVAMREAAQRRAQAERSAAHAGAMLARAERMPGYRVESALRRRLRRFKP